MLEDQIKSKAEDNQVEFTYNRERNEVTATSLNAKDIQRFMNAVEKEIEYILNMENMSAIKTKK